MSPALLSKRLKELEAAKIVERVPVDREPGVFEYRLTEAGRELRPVIEAIGCWGQRWIDLEATLEKLDPNLLMWDMRRNLDPNPMPGGPQHDPDHLHRPAGVAAELVAGGEPGKEVDLCSVDPGFDVDLYSVNGPADDDRDLDGLRPVGRAKETGKLLVTGDRRLETTVDAWLGLSPFARSREEGRLRATRRRPLRRRADSVDAVNRQGA